MSTCIHHPNVIATVRCKRCGNPLCEDCKMVSEVGVVCSQRCLDAIKAFQDRVGDDVPGRARRPLMRRGIVRVGMIIVALLGIAYAVLCFRSGRLLDPADVLDWLQNLL